MSIALYYYFYKTHYSFMDTKKKKKRLMRYIILIYNKHISIEDYLNKECSQGCRVVQDTKYYSY